MNLSSPMPAGTCPSCGAPLAAPAATVQQCPFCHVAMHANAGSPYRVPAAPAMAVPASGFRLGGFIALLSLLPALGGVAVGVQSILRSVGHGSTVKVASLATAPLDQGWTAIDASGLVGNFSSFDAVANLAWAHGVATAWKADAALFRIDTDRVNKDGAVDIVNTPDAEVEYRFTSPSCVAAHKASTAVVDPKLACELDMHVKARAGTPVVEVLAFPSLTMVASERPIADPACTLARSFAALQAANALLPRPVYNASIYSFAMSDDAADRPEWTFNTVIAGQGSIPNVNAATCVVAGHEPPATTAASASAATPADALATTPPHKPGLADEPVELTWTGRITSSKGKAPRVGASCTLSATVVPSGDAVESKRTLLVCQGQTVYDSAVPLFGMANAFFTLDEKPVAGPAPSFVYQLGAEDVGTRSGPRAQLMVFTPRRKLDAFREGESPFHVKVAIAASSVARQGKPLLAETLDAPPAAAAPGAQPKSSGAVSSAHSRAARGIRR